MLSQELDFPYQSCCSIQVLADTETPLSIQEIKQLPAPVIGSVRCLGSTQATRGKGYLQLLECVCLCPQPTRDAFESSLAKGGWRLVGRRLQQGRRPMKSLTAWTLTGTEMSLAISVDTPERLLKALSDEAGQFERRQAHCREAKKADAPTEKR